MKLYWDRRWDRPERVLLRCGRGAAGSLEIRDLWQHIEIILGKASPGERLQLAVSALDFGNVALGLWTGCGQNVGAVARSGLLG